MLGRSRRPQLVVPCRVAGGFALSGGAAIAAIGTSLVIPGLGLVVAGPLAAALAGAGAGGTAGGLIGALVGHGMPEDRTKKYELTSTAAES